MVCNKIPYDGAVQEIISKFGGLDGVTSIVKLRSSNSYTANITVDYWHTYLAVGTYTQALGMWLILVKNSGNFEVQPILSNGIFSFDMVDATTLAVTATQNSNITLFDMGKS